MDEQIIPLKLRTAPVEMGAHMTCRITDSSRQEIWCTGVVDYIHPQHRYYTVRFDFAGGSFRESYKWDFVE